MGNRASRPVRKFAGTISKAENVIGSSAPRVHLPSQELKDRFEHSATDASQLANEQAAIPSDQKAKQYQTVTKAGEHAHLNKKEMPEGKDGMDPQADSNYIEFINNLGRQIHSHTDNPTGEPVNVRALKQLLNRKQLFQKGQDEVQAQLGSKPGDRSMVHPRTLTAIVYALNDPRVSRDDVLKDYQINNDFLKNMDRFKVAENVVIIEEPTKEDEIGPKLGQPVPRAASDPSLMDENGTVSESINKDRMKELRSRLE